MNLSTAKRQTNSRIARVNFSRAPKRVTATSTWRSRTETEFAKQSDWHYRERLFSQVFENSSQPMSITSFADGRYVEVNSTFLALLGYTREQVLGRTSLELGIWKKSAQHSELVEMLKRDGRVRDFETVLRGAEGQTLLWLSRADLIEIDGQCCILVMSNDITERRRSEETLKNVSTQLIRAQEEERNRIARELHDGLNQKLAMLCVDLDELRQNDVDLTNGEKLNALLLRLQDASADVHGLSRRLHPSNLDHLGLLPAVKSLCRELSGRRGLSIKFACSHDRSHFDEPDKELALCVYRIVQEALSNVIKHSGASTARVQLKWQKQVLYVLITDWGKGFNVEDAKLKGRLGLIGIEERLRLANGKLIIRSRPDCGTQIEGRLPLPN